MAASSPKSPPSYHLLAIIILIIILIAAAARICDSEKNIVSGFSSTLIHRDHPNSPLYDPTLTKWERVAAAVRRSLPPKKSLANTIQQSNTGGDILSFMSPHGGEYLMEFKMSNPSFNIFGVIDTGSDLTWVQCFPCLSFDQKQCWDPSNAFDPSRSLTYQDQECSESKTCWDISPMFSCDDGTCKYTAKYGDGSITRGDVARINIGFSPNDSYSIFFGCCHDNVLTTGLRVQGLVGLGMGRLSLIKQLEISSFSHCFDLLTDVYSTYLRPVMRFGTESILDGGSTPILEGNFMDQHYYLHLEGISIGKNRVDLPDGYTFNITDTGRKGFLTDTGTTITRLEKHGYDAVVNSMTSAVTLEPCAAHEERLKPCYCSVNMEIIQILAPALTYHFGGGLSLTLDKDSTWLEVESGKYCLALMDSGVDETSIFGNYNQRNINVGYDLVNKQIHFEPMNNCLSTYGHVCLEGEC